MYTLSNIASFNFFKFCCFKQSINTLKFKALYFQKLLLLLFTAWKFVKKLPGNLTNLYSYCFVIIFNLTLQQGFLLIKLNKEIFVSKCLVSLLYLHLKISNKHSLWRKTIQSSSSVFSILYFFSQMLQIEKIILLYFEGIWR